MVWILIEAALALALLVGVVVWVALPAQRVTTKRRRGAESTAPGKSPEEERERETGDLGGKENP